MSDRACRIVGWILVVVGAGEAIGWPGWALAIGVLLVVSFPAGGGERRP